MRITVNLDGLEVELHPGSNWDLAALVGCVSESSEGLSVLARHPSFEVRRRVAQQGALPFEAWMTLINDPHPEVAAEAAGVRDHLVAFGAERWAETLKQRWWLLTQIIIYLDDIYDDGSADEAALTSLTEAILESPDPSMLKQIAEMAHMPKVLLRALSKHQDASVAASARSSLMQRG
ncbi:hypothetical protein [Polycyclovorans algicola]|uniref:hypothetical protein n=1 Tax=Polycyclovorans algicola TaxID=616992 RepID=UPI001267C8FC|nr:hypothetical protein [Polycyclovorans algicola]